MIPFRRRRLLAAAVAALVLGAAAAPQAEAYRLAGHRFAVRTITYQVALPALRGPVDAAARAWNRSGARIRFARSSRRRARVLVRELPGSGCRGALASIAYARGIARRAVVYLPLRGCDDTRFLLTIAAAHELGHVLGLAHENRRCALMNEAGDRFGGVRCASRRNPPPQWLWRCRILEPDDVRGAVAIYGGRVRERRRPPLCAMYSAASAPAGLTAQVVNGIVTAAFQRPDDPSVPRFLRRSAGGYVLSVERDRCAAPTVGEPAPWDVPIGQLQQASAPIAGPGRYCVSVFAVDAAGRPGDAASVWVDAP